MKKYIFAYILLICITACTTKAVDNGLTLTGEKKSSYTKTAVGGDDIIRFSAESAWDITINKNAESWCSVSKNSGESGENEFTIEIYPNSIKEPRSGNITIHSGKSSLTISISQTWDPLEIIHFSNAKFKEHIIARVGTDIKEPWDLKIDTNDDNEISISEAQEVMDIDCADSEIPSLEDIKYFSNLEILVCNGNQLPSLDVSQNVKLVGIDCSFNEITTLDLSKNINLSWLGCSSNKLSNVDLSNNAELTQLICFSNEITSIDFSKNSKLSYLTCHSNDISTLDLSNNVKMNFLDCAPMTTLEKLVLRTGQNINFITAKRNPNFIPAETTIEYK